MNFGLLGMLAGPGLISFLMARAFVNAKQKQTAPAYFLLFSFLGMFFVERCIRLLRSYKCFLTAVILLFCFSAVHTVLGRGKP